MKTAKRFVLFFVVVIVLAGLWSWRYVTMNAYYDSFCNITDVFYQTGDIVPFGKNKTNEGLVFDGYSIRVEGLEIMEFDDFIQSTGIAKEELLTTGDRIALVHITLINENCNEGVLLTELELHGTDNCVNMNWGLLVKLNPELQGFQVARLEYGQECELVLPYNIPRNYFGSYTWNNMDKYDWMLRITSWPEQIDIRVTPNAE